MKYTRISRWYERCFTDGMFKKLLLSLGLAKAPAPVRSYVAASSFVGAPLALAYVAWKYRHKLGPALRRAHLLPQGSAQPAAV